MRIPPEIIEEIRSAIDIVDLIASYLQLKKRGKNYVTLCPFHSEKTPSFYISPDRQMYHCFGCGASGNVFTFLMEFEKISFVDAVKLLAERAGIKLPDYSFELDNKAKEQEELYQTMKLAATFYYKNLYETEEGKYALEYLFNRGFTSNTIKTFGLGYSLNRWDALLKYAADQKISPELLEKVGLVKKNNDGSYYDTFRGRIMFPIISISGKVVGFGARKLFEDDLLGKYINSPETPIYNKSKILYGLYFSKESIRDKNYAILVEGYVDLIKTYQAGFTNVVASSGTALTVEQIKLISRYTKNITIIYDADSAGAKATLRGIDLILENDLDVKVAPLPSGEDPDSFIEKYGKDKFENILSNSVLFVDFMIDALEANGLMENPAGQTAVVRAIIQTLSKIRDPIKRNFYIKHIAERYGIYESVLLGEMDKYLSKEQNKSSIQYAGEIKIQKQVLTDKQDEQIENIPVAEKDLLHAMIDGGDELADFVFKYLSLEDFTNKFSAKIFEYLKEMRNKNLKIDPPTLYDFIINEEVQDKQKLQQVVNNIVFSKYEISKHWEEIGQEISYGDALKIVKDCIRKIFKNQLYKKLEQNQFLMKEAQKRGEDLSRYLATHSDLITKIKQVDSEDYFMID